MGVYIPSMKMPEACFERGHGYVCPYIIMCQINKEEFAKTGKPAGVGKRLAGCPLIEVPVPHGRLIDAHEVRTRMIGLSFSVQTWISEVELSNVPTVIEREEE